MKKLALCILCTVLLALLGYLIHALGTLFLSTSPFSCHSIAPDWMVALPAGVQNGDQCLVVDNPRQLQKWLSRAEWANSYLEDGMSPHAWLCIVDNHQNSLLLWGYQDFTPAYNLRFFLKTREYTRSIPEGSHFAYAFTCPRTIPLADLLEVLSPANGWYVFLPKTGQITHEYYTLTVAAPAALSQADLADLQKQWGLLLSERPLP